MIKANEQHCLKCIHGGKNFWEHVECWKFNEELDYETTHNTADREKTSRIYNYGEDCPYFEKRSLWWKLKNSTLGFRINYLYWKWKNEDD